MAEEDASKILIWLLPLALLLAVSGGWLLRMLDRKIALGQIVDNLMLLARSDSGDYPNHKQLFRLDVVLREVYEDLQILAESRPITVHLQCEEAVEFFGDELLIRRLLLNLCDNALKHTAQGKIELALRKAERHVEFAITDSGSGLGLAICQWIVAAHGGQDRGEKRTCTHDNRARIAA